MAKSKPRQNSNRGSQDPPQFNMQPTNRRRLRFISAATESVTDVIHSGDILAALGVFTTGNDSGTKTFTIAAAARIKSIEIWAAPKADSSGAWNSAYVEWRNSTAFSKSTKTEDASISNARPLHVFTKPPKESVSNLWFHGMGVELLRIKVPTGSIIDVVCEYLICDKDEPQQVVTDPITEGHILYLGLNRQSLNCFPQIDRDQ